MRLSTAVTGALLAALALAGPAAADWSAPQTARAATWMTAATAVNARGEVAVAWATLSDPLRKARPGTSVHVTMRSTAGRLTSRTLWTSRRETPDGVAVTIDHRGEITVAWIAARPAERIKEGTHGTVRAVHGRAGRWSRVQVLGAGAADPSVAVGPNRDVVLTWVGTRASVFRLGAAWRTHGHRFGRVQSLTRPRVKWTPTSPMGPPVARFDAGGTAYLAGSCDGVIRTAGPRAHRFGAPISVSGQSVLGLSLAVGDAGRGVVSWIDGGFCNADIGGEGDRGGPVAARTLNAGALAPPVTLDAGADPAYETWAVATPGGEGFVSWSVRSGAAAGVHTAALRADGAFGPGTIATDALAPTAADGGGDVVYTTAFGGPPGPYPFGTPGLRAAGTTTTQAPPNRGQIVVAPTGRAALATATPSGRISVSVWRP